MKDGLACARACVDDGAIAALGKSLLVSDAGGDAQKVAERRLITLRSFVQRFYVLTRDDQNMRGRLRVDVANSYGAVIRVDNICGNLARNHSTKETIHKTSDG